MAMVIFTALNGMGVVFLLYVLVQFWKEGYRSQETGARRDAIAGFGMDGPDVIVVTHIVDSAAQQPNDEALVHGVESAVTFEIEPGSIKFRLCDLDSARQKHAS